MSTLEWLKAWVRRVSADWGGHEGASIACLGGDPAQAVRRVQIYMHAHGDANELPLTSEAEDAPG
jgi:hypothetical protein